MKGEERDILRLFGQVPGKRGSAEVKEELGHYSILKAHDY